MTILGSSLLIANIPSLEPTNTTMMLPGQPDSQKVQNSLNAVLVRFAVSNMYALKEHVDVEFVVKAPEVEKKKISKSRTRGTVGKTNKPVGKAAERGGSSSVDGGRGARASSRRDDKSDAPEPGNHYSRDVLDEPPASSYMNAPPKSNSSAAEGANEAKSSTKPIIAGGADPKKKYPNRPMSAANPSKRFSAGRAFVMKQELPWNYDLSLADRDLMTLERDAYIQSKKAAKEKIEKKVGAKSEGNDTPGMSKVNSRTRAVKSVSGTALNGSSKTVFALVGQKEKEALNKAVTRGGTHSQNHVGKRGDAEDGADGPKPLIDKYKVTRESGIHAQPWDNSELPPERTSKEVRMLPAATSRLVPMTGADHHYDVSYKSRSALRATEDGEASDGNGDGGGTGAGAVDGFGRRKVRGNEAVTKESSLSGLASEY